jgi:tetratricopeptide (TPR) repeat protein
MRLVLAQRERECAVGSLRIARAAVDQSFMQVSEDQRLNQPGLHPLRKSLLANAQHVYEDFLRLHGSDSLVQGERAAVHDHLAKIANLTGSPSESMAHYQQAVTLWEKVLAEQPGNRNHQANLARTLKDFGEVLMAREARLDEALQSFRRAQELVEALIAGDPQSVPCRLQLGAILLDISEIQVHRGEPNLATEALELVLAIEFELAAEDTQSIEPPISLAKAQASLGRLLLNQPDQCLQAAIAFHRAIEIRERLTQDHPELADQSCELALDLRNLSILQQKLRQPEAAFMNLSRSLEIFERVDQLYPGVINFQQGLGSTYNLMSNLERQRGERTDAFTFAQKARTVFERLGSTDPEDASWRLELAKSHNNMGRLLREAGKPAEALRSFQRAVDVYEGQPALDPENSFNLACNLALCMPLIGDDGGSQGARSAPLKPSKSDELRRKLYGDRGMEALRVSAAAGFVSPQVLQTDTDLDPLRSRPDFQALMKEVEEKPTSVRK